MQKRKDKINRKKYHFILVIAAIAIVVLLDAGMILMPDHTSLIWKTVHSRHFQS